MVEQSFVSKYKQLTVTNKQKRKSIMLKVTAKDALRSSIVAPGWYLAKVTDMTPKPTAGGSIQYLYELEIESSLNGTASPFDKTPLRPYAVNAGGIGFAIPFLVACGLPKEALEEVKKGGSDIEVDETAPVGKTIKVLVANTEWNNRKQNEAVDFMPLS